jgi:hypothetical protein
MSSITALRFQPEPIRSVLWSGTGAGYVPIGGPLVKPVRIIDIQNLTDAAMMFSFDFTDDHFALPANGYKILDIKANDLYVAEYTKIYVKRIGVPTASSVYVSVIYGAQ